MKVKIKTFPNVENLKELTTSRPTLQEMFKSFRLKENDTRERNTHLQNGTKTTGNSNYMGKYIGLFFSPFKSL